MGQIIQVAARIWQPFIGNFSMVSKELSGLNTIVLAMSF
jgi:hypothetical protein